MTDSYEVVVVGGGPAGMWLATELSRAKVSVVVLEKRAERPPQSKALTVYPRTVEMLAMRGLADRFLAEGSPVPSSHFAILSNRLDFSSLDTRYPFTLFLPQRRTEELLNEHLDELGVPLLRSYEVTGVRQHTTGVEVDVATPSGPATISAAYVVGCDGAGSAVRQAAGVEFEGTPSSWYSVLGDVKLADPPAGRALTMCPPGGALYMVALRDRFNRILGENEALCRSLAVRLSGLGVAYAVSGSAGLGQSPLAGQRVPDLPLRGARPASVYELLHQGTFVLLTLSREARQPQPGDLQKYSGRLTVAAGELADGRPDWASPHTLLIRPDGYVAWAPPASEPPADPPLGAWLG